MKKAINNPSTLHYKGITLTPGGYAAAETVYRTKATGGDIPTAFSAIPYEHADAYSLSEFYGSARQSRVTLMAEGKTNWGTLRGYYEADWLGTGIYVQQQPVQQLCAAPARRSGLRPRPTTIGRSPAASCGLSPRKTRRASPTSPATS